VAIYHFSAQVLGRGKGRKNLDGSTKQRPDNAVAAAAYRAGEKLRDDKQGRAQDYSQRPGVAHREIIVPEGGAAWLADREKLWNTVERMEHRADAQLAREINIALPHELTGDQRREMVQSYIRAQFTARGMVADFALHDPVPARGDDPRNFHAHIMLTLRKATGAGLHEVKTREWNSREVLKGWREAWQSHANRALEQAGKRERIDHRTLVEQRAAALERGDRKAAAVLDRAPEIHVGPKPRAMQGRAAEPTSQTRRRGNARRERPPHQLRESPPKRQSYEAFQRERATRRDAEREMFAQERLQRAEERWARQREWEERQRERRFKQELWEKRQAEFAARKEVRTKEPPRREAAGPKHYRSRDYAGTDQGPRSGWLWETLAGNNAKLKADLSRIEARSARFQQWIDYYDRKATWWLDGKIGGAGYRYQRWQQARTERERRQIEQEKARHARKRAAQLQAITTGLRQLAALLSGRQEAGLRRARQVEGWGRAGAREAGRGLVPQRERGRRAPSGHSGPASAGGGSKWPG
jgi:hypothetical protein